jgi:hypothetical protein
MTQPKFKEGQVKTGKDGKKSRILIMDVMDIKGRIEKVVSDGKERSTFTSQEDHARLDYIRQHPEQKLDSFYGKFKDQDGKTKDATGFDLASWVRNGFRSKSFNSIAERMPMGLQHRPTWNEEEGDIDVGRLYGGFDDYMMGPVEQKAKPGIRIQFGFCFSCGVSNEIIAEYGAFIMALIAGMESEGFELTVDALIAVRDPFVGENGVTNNLLVRVKRAGEASDSLNWSVLFSPVGFRVLGFEAICMAGDRLGKATNGHLGYPATGHKWDLTYDHETSTVTIMCNSSAYSGEQVPAEALLKKAVDEGLLPEQDV